MKTSAGEAMHKKGWIMPDTSIADVLKSAAAL
jgi:hypothetical protein